MVISLLSIWYMTCARQKHPPSVGKLVRKCRICIYRHHYPCKTLYRSNQNNHNGKNGKRTWTSKKCFDYYTNLTWNNFRFVDYRHMMKYDSYNCKNSLWYLRNVEKNQTSDINKENTSGIFVYGGDENDLPIYPKPLSVS